MWLWLTDIPAMHVFKGAADIDIIQYGKHKQGDL